MLEKWEGIKDFEDYYEVSTFGRVMSLAREFPDSITGKLYLRKERLMKGNGTNRNHPKKIVMIVDGVKTESTIGRLVAEAFLGFDRNDRTKIISYKDLDKWNNRVENIKIITVSEKQLRDYKTGVNKVTENYWCYSAHPHRGKFGKDNSHSKSVLQYSKEGAFIKEWGGMREVHRHLKINATHIGDCCKGKAITAGGFIWKYKLEGKS